MLRHEMTHAASLPDGASGPAPVSACATPDADPATSGALF